MQWPPVRVERSAQPSPRRSLAFSTTTSKRPWASGQSSTRATSSGAEALGLRRELLASGQDLDRAGAAARAICTA